MKRLYLRVYRPFDKCEKLICEWFYKIILDHSELIAYFEYGTFKGSYIQFVFFTEGITPFEKELTESIQKYINTILKPIVLKTNPPKIDKYFMDYPVNWLMCSPLVHIEPIDSADYIKSVNSLVLNMYVDKEISVKEFSTSIPAQLLLLQLLVNCDSKKEMLSFLERLFDSSINSNRKFARNNLPMISRAYELVKEDFDDITRGYWKDQDANYQMELLSLWQEVFMEGKPYYKNKEEKCALFHSRYDRLFLSLDYDIFNRMFVIELIKKYINLSGII